MKRAIFIGVFFVLFSRVCDGQWYCLTKVQDHIGVVTFLNQIGLPKVGFVGTGWSSRDSRADVWKTTDGGLTWEKCYINAKTSHFNYGITNFAFIDSQIGFFSSGFTTSNLNTGIYKTTDGGKNWGQIFQSPFGVCTNISYIPSTNILLVSRWYDQSLISSDMGLNFTKIPFSNTFTGAAFLDPMNGMVCVGIDPQNPSPPGINLTSDGGYTWRELPLSFESWQPLSLPSQNSYITISEISGDVYRSDDAGNTWRILSNVPYNKGHIVGNETILFTQSQGILASRDGGYSWVTLCGPAIEFADTRMYYNNGLLYAHDVEISLSDDIGRLWVNTTGNGSGERLLLSHSSGNREFDLLVGDTWSVDLALPDTFSTIQWLKLDSLSFTLRFECDVLSLKDAIAASGWRLVSATENLGRVFVKLVRESGSDRGVPVATVNFQANIARETESDVYIDSVFYNEGEFTNCEVLASEKLHITINDECGDSTLREFINSKPILEIASIHPNPTNGDVTIDFRTLVDGDVSLEVYDNNVRGLIREVIPSKAGITSKTLDLSQFFGGAFFVQLTLGKDVVTGKFVKQ